MKGSCLCGAVTYEAGAPGLAMGHCSCRTCRKAHAAPFTTTGRVPREKFRWLSGADKLATLRLAQQGISPQYPVSCVLHQTQTPVALWISSSTTPA